MATIDLPAQSALFLHVPKTAGYSISSALHEQLEGAKRHPVRGMSRLHGAAHHASRRLGRKRLPNRWSFCFLRDPWDWAVSGWLHVTANEKIYGERPPDFDAFIRGDWTRNLVHNPEPKKFRSARLFVAYHTQVTQTGHLAFGRRGEPAPLAFFARFERLAEDWQRICERLGREIELPHRNRSEREDYTTYYTDETRRIVARRNADLIERFGYRFGA